jgi:hypothetical protein
LLFCIILYTSVNSIGSHITEVHFHCSPPFSDFFFFVDDVHFTAICCHVKLKYTFSCSAETRNFCISFSSKTQRDVPYKKNKNKKKFWFQVFNWHNFFFYITTTVLIILTNPPRNKTDPRTSCLKNKRQNKVCGIRSACPCVKLVTRGNIQTQEIKVHSGTENQSNYKPLRVSESQSVLIVMSVFVGKTL